MGRYSRNGSVEHIGTCHADTEMVLFLWCSGYSMMRIARVLRCPVSSIQACIRTLNEESGYCRPVNTGCRRSPQILPGG